MSPYPTESPPVASHPTGFDYLNAITDLLQRARLEDPLAGLYEAADLQWWWREDDAAVPDRQTFWSFPDRPSCACLLLYDDGDEWNGDSFWLPSYAPSYRTQVWPSVLERMASLTKPSTFTVREDETTLRSDLEANDYRETEFTGMQLVLYDTPPTPQLPDGFAIESRHDVHNRAGETGTTESHPPGESTPPHPMRARNGDEVERKLRECSLYRPELDLAVRHSSGRPAAYGLFWIDPVTRVGLVEPMRTDEEFQGRGLARCLLAEGLDRLRRAGAAIYKVSYRESNEPARRLYTGAGFKPVIRKLEYRNGPETAKRSAFGAF